MQARSAISPKNTLPAYERMLTPTPIEPLCGTQKCISAMRCPHRYSGACGPGTFEATSDPLRLNSSMAGPCTTFGIMPSRPSTVSVSGGCCEPFSARIVSCIA